MLDFSIKKDPQTDYTRSEIHERQTVIIMSKQPHRTRPQKHQNATKFRNNLHDNSNFIKMLNNMEVIGACKRCKEQIEWRITYKKYKGLAAPKKCVKCEQKTVKRAYTSVCQPCGEKLKICVKCLQPSDQLSVKTKLSPEEELLQQQALESDLKHLSERKRRSVLRQMAKGKSITSSQPSTSDPLPSSNPISDWLDNSQQPSFSEDGSSDDESPEDENSETEADESKLDIESLPSKEFDDQKSAHEDSFSPLEVTLDNLSLSANSERKHVTFEDLSG